MNVQNLFKFFALSIVTFLLAGCSQDNRFPLLGENWKRLSDCELVEGLEMVAQANEVSGEAIIAYFDPDDPEGNELYQENYIMEPGQDYDSEGSKWYSVDEDNSMSSGVGSGSGRDINNLDRVLIKTSESKSMMRRDDPPYRIWFWNAENHYCTSLDE